MIDVGDQRVDEQGVNGQEVNGYRCRTADERAGGGMYASRPLAYVCRCMCAPGSYLRVPSYCLVLQVCDCLVSTHVLISHELLNAVGVHVHVFLAAQGTDFSTDTVGDFTLNAVAHV